MYKEIGGISTPNDEDTLWRYMSFEQFVNILATESLFFTRAYKYDDPFEGYIHKVTTKSINDIFDDINIANMNNVDKAKLYAILRKHEIEQKYIMCNCWHKSSDESMGMWEKYHLRNSGIAIKTTMAKLKESITDTINVYIGNIEYISRENFQRQYVKKVNDLILNSQPILYHPYFYKRDVFKYEQEVRVIIDIESIMGDVFERLKDEDFSNPDIIASEFPDISNQGKAYDVDVNTLVEEIIISPYAESWIENTVRLIVQKYGFKFDVNSSTLLDLP